MCEVVLLYDGVANLVDMNENWKPRESFRQGDALNFLRTNHVDNRQLHVLYRMVQIFASEPYTGGLWLIGKGSDG